MNNFKCPHTDPHILHENLTILHVFYFTPYRTKLTQHNHIGQEYVALQYVHVTDNYHYTGSYDSTSKWLKIIAIHVHNLYYVTYDYHHTGSYYRTSMWLLIITIQVRITVRLCDLQLAEYRLILQPVYVTYHYHHTGSYYSTSMWLTVITIQVHITVRLCDLPLAPYSTSMWVAIITIQVHIAVGYVTYNYHHTGPYYSTSMWLTIITIVLYVYVTYHYHHTGSYYCESMWLTISRIQFHITARLCDLPLSPYRFILQ
jgi:hypothetical protein